MKPRAHLQQGGHASPEDGLALGGRGDAREDLQQRTLPGAVAADNPQHFPTGNVQRHLPQGPKVRGSARKPAPPPDHADEVLPQRPVTPPGSRAYAVFFSQPAGGNHRVAGHM